MKIVFMGTPDFALEALKRLATEHEIVCVYTRAPKEAGRGKELKKSEVHLFSEEKGFEVRTPKTLRDETAQEALRALKADIIIVAAYGLILPKAVIEAFPYGCLNIHASLLPRWRGAAPIQRAIEAGDQESGVTIMRVVEALDAGEMFLKGSVKITDQTTGGMLHDQLAALGADLISEALKNVDTLKPTPQDETLVTYAAKIEKSESLLDFRKPAKELELKIRAFNPFPGCFFEHNGERFKILRAKIADQTGVPGEISTPKGKLLISCGENALDVLEIQRQGKRAMSAEELLRGYSFGTLK